MDGPDLAESVHAAVGGAPVRLALDAVAGQATGRLAGAAADGGTVCNYGAMTGGGVVVDYADLIFRGVSVVGFMVGRFLARRTLADIRAIYAKIAVQVREGGLGAPVEAVYPIEEIGAALAHAQRPAKSGKVLVAPNGII